MHTQSHKEAPHKANHLHKDPQAPANKWGHFNNTHIVSSSAHGRLHSSTNTQLQADNETYGALTLVLKKEICVPCFSKHTFYELVIQRASVSLLPYTEELNVTLLSYTILDCWARLFFIATAFGQCHIEGLKCTALGVLYILSVLFITWTHIASSASVVLFHQWLPK